MAGIFGRSLGRTRVRLGRALRALRANPRPDSGVLEELEEALIAADVGPTVAFRLVGALRSGTDDVTDPRQRLRAAMLDRLVSSASANSTGPQPGSATPWVALLVGVNGSGKTTTAAKLAARFRSRGCTVVLGAADTFRAAAVEQLQVWGDRLGVPVVAHRPGGDPAAVVYDTCDAARARGVDAALIDTAGRLHTKADLMAELSKMRRAAGKVIADAPDEVWLVLDATNGQDGLRQAEEFLEHAGVTGLILAKLDGSARGGVAFAIAERLDLPIRYVGTGEGLENLATFDPEAYVDALLTEDK